MTIPKTAEILRALIAFPTVSRESNLEMLDHIEALLAPTGARMERFAHPDRTRANLWVTLGPEGSGGVVLSGHTDVVPVTGQNWSHDPFEMVERDGRLYGRGTTDMKGFLAAAIRAALIASERELKVPLHLAFSYDEELGCLGVRGLIDALAARPDRPAMCIIGEPTGMKIASGHKGKTSYRACCHGREGHSALAPNALNALHLGTAFIASLQAQQAALVERGARDPAYDIPYTTIHAGVIRGGHALNIVPNLCEVDFEIRNIVDDDPDVILSRIKDDAAAIVAPHLGTFPEAAIRIETISGYPGLETPETDAAIQLMRQITGENDPTTKVAFGTEGGLFQAGLGMSTAICGPGFMDQGHKPDEFISRSQLDLCDEMLGRLIDLLSA